MRFLTLTLLLALTAACASPGRSGQAPQLMSAPQLTKGPVVYADRMESTPVVWNDGSLLDIVSKRNVSSTTDMCAVSGLEIFRSGKLIKTLPVTFGFISAIVSHGTLYVFGTYQCPSSRIVLISTTDLTHWSAEVTVLSAAAPVKLYNTSVTADASGFVMASERSDEHGSFTTEFFSSRDLLSWTKTGGSFNGECPALRYDKGQYYVIYMLPVWDGAYYATFIARTPDFRHWLVSPQTVLSPLDAKDEGNNNSDADLVEYGGQVRLRYAVGTQVIGPGSFTNIKEATFEGSMSEFLSSFFEAAEK